MRPYRVLEIVVVIVGLAALVGTFVLAGIEFSRFAGW